MNVHDIPNRFIGKFRRDDRTMISPGYQVGNYRSSRQCSDCLINVCGKESVTKRGLSGSGIPHKCFDFMAGRIRIIPDDGAKFSGARSFDGGIILGENGEGFPDRPPAFGMLGEEIG
jgi:hypothetical protein